MFTSVHKPTEINSICEYFGISKDRARELSLLVENAALKIISDSAISIATDDDNYTINTNSLIDEALRIGQTDAEQLYCVYQAAIINPKIKNILETLTTLYS